MSKNILDIDSLLAEQNELVSWADNSIEQEAKNLAWAMATKIFNILKDEFLSSSITATKDRNARIITWVETDIVIEDKHKNAPCIEAVIKWLKDSLETDWYEVTVKAKVADILLYKSIPVEVAIPESKLESKWIEKKVKRIRIGKRFS